MYDKANYFAILPSAVRYNPKLTARSVLLYALLTSLACADGEAYAANAYLSDALGTSERTINRLLAELTREKYISIRYDYKDGTQEIYKRFIRINDLPLLLDMPKTQALYAVIPTHILAMPELSVQAKLLYAEISAATPTDGFCGKPATFFADLMNIGASTVRRLIKELCDVDAMRVEMEYKGDTREIYRRRIYLTEAAVVVEKRANLAADGSKDVGSSNEPNEPNAANTPEKQQIRGMLTFVTTSETPENGRRKMRKIHRKRKKATEKLRL